MNSTKRNNSEALEIILDETFPILDHGFIRIVDYMGNDDSIVEAARLSYQKGTKRTLEDEKLIRYLLRHKHTTPFEMCEIKFHIKLPIFVARQWIRHRTANVNEYSGRYSVLDNEFYLPQAENLLAQSETNKQGRGRSLPLEIVEQCLDSIKKHSEQCYAKYEFLLSPMGNGNEGVARELARAVLPVNFYTQWYWKIDLHNLFNFLRLRCDSHAQWEIRQYANRIYEICKAWVPVATQAFTDYIHEAESFSKQEMKTVRTLLNQYCPTGEITETANQYGLMGREFNEFMGKVKE